MSMLLGICSTKPTGFKSFGDMEWPAWHHAFIVQPSILNFLTDADV
jgi:hypothetical protein